MARLAAAKGGKTRAIVKLLGRAAIVLTASALELASWLLWAGFALFAFCASCKAAAERSTQPVEHEAPAETAFIPPQPERAVVRPRMPRIEDLPLPAQNEIRAKRAAVAAEADKPKMSLLQRLASVGLGGTRKDEQPAPRPQAPRPTGRPVMGERLPPFPANRPQDSRGLEARPQEPVSEYAKRAPAPRPAQQGLDTHGRPAPVAPAMDDDQLEIPAFLRRQAN